MYIFYFDAPLYGTNIIQDSLLSQFVLRRAERVSSVDQSISISTRRYEPQLESVYHTPIWTATGIHCVLDMSDHKGFSEAEC